MYIVKLTINIARQIMNFVDSTVPFVVLKIVIVLATIYNYD